jgi:hypothetical protein
VLASSPENRTELMHLDELFWDDLLLYLEQRQVIPIIGQDLLTVEIDGRSVTLTA